MLQKKFKEQIKAVKSLLSNVEWLSYKAVANATYTSFVYDKSDEERIDEIKTIILSIEKELNHLYLSVDEKCLKHVK